MERERDCAPVPHDLVQVDQASNADVAQWMAHWCWLQTRVSSRVHSAPPKSSCATTVRVRDWPPPPHELVQVDHAVHVLGTQSTGHSTALQERNSWP
jgi:hypothetical protein